MLIHTHKITTMSRIFPIRRSSQVNIWFDPQQIVTKRFSMVLGAISGHKQHTKSLGEFESRKVFFFKMASKMAAITIK